MGKKNIERVKLCGVKLNEDLVVISKFTIDEDCMFMPYEEDMDLSNIEHVLERNMPWRFIPLRNTIKKGMKVMCEKEKKNITHEPRGMCFSLWTTGERRTCPLSTPFF